MNRERIQEIIARIEMFGHGAGYTVDEVYELARMALAVMDSEPVAYRWNYGGTTIWRLLDTKPGPGSNPRFPRVIEPLYRHAQPCSTEVNFEQHKLRELVDLVWNTATESTEVPSTKWADELITKVFGVYKNDN